jgi:hypothetical protein
VDLSANQLLLLDAALVDSYRAGLLADLVEHAAANQMQKTLSKHRTTDHKKE